MRMKGSVRQVINPITKKLVYSPYPLTRDEAFEEDIVKYWPMTPCPTHGDPSVVYALTDIYACCAHHGAAAAYNEAMRNGEPRTLGEARTQGVDFYWNPQPHARCGHPGKTTYTNKCWFCENSKAISPRLQAIAEGKVWYTPTTPCPRCGTLEQRQVHNGRCRGCEQKHKAAAPEAPPTPKPEAPLPMHKQFPDMILTRDAAISLGMKVYRTGNPCSRGHRAWRYVSTGGCLDCKEGVPAVQGVVV